MTCNVDKIVTKKENKSIENILMIYRGILELERVMRRMLMKRI